jgi:hypothetical protein
MRFNLEKETNMGEEILIDTNFSKINFLRINVDEGISHLVGVEGLSKADVSPKILTVNTRHIYLFKYEDNTSASICFYNNDTEYCISIEQYNYLHKRLYGI